MRHEINNIYDLYKEGVTLFESDDRKTIHMSREELRNYLANLRGGTNFISVDYESNIKVLKKDRVTKEPIPTDTEIKKTSTIDCILTSTSYNDAVFNTITTKGGGGRADDPSKWKVEPLWARADGSAGGERVSDFLAFNFASQQYYIYLLGKPGGVKTKNVTFYLNGNPVRFDEIRNMVSTSEDPIKKEEPDISKKQAGFGIESESQIRPRMIALRNIKGVRINKLNIIVS